MRNVLIGVVCLLVAANLFGGSCGNPYVQITNINGDLPSPCTGAFEYMTVDLSPKALTITKAIDKASPQLMMACVSGKPLQEATLKPSAAVTMKFKQLLVSSYSQNVNGANASETVTITFQQSESQTSTGTQTRYLGMAHPTSVQVFVSSGGGAPAEPATQFQTNIRAGGASTTSVQFATKPVAVRAGMAPQSQPPAASNGFIELRSLGGGTLARYQYTGGVRSVTGNLRIERLLVAPR